jgi:hypothetical protein
MDPATHNTLIILAMACLWATGAIALLRGHCDECPEKNRPMTDDEKQRHQFWHQRKFPGCKRCEEIHG